MKTEKITITPETLPFCCLRCVECGKKNAYTRLSLSLSLSLSPPLEKRAKGEVGGSWPLVRSNHPSCHLQPPGLPYRFDIYPPDADRRVYVECNARPPSHPPSFMLLYSERTFHFCFSDPIRGSSAIASDRQTARPPGNAHVF